MGILRYRPGGMVRAVIEAIQPRLVLGQFAFHLAVNKINISFAKESAGHTRLVGHYYHGNAKLIQSGDGLC